MQGERFHYVPNAAMLQEVDAYVAKNRMYVARPDDSACEQMLDRLTKIDGDLNKLRHLKTRRAALAKIFELRRPCRGKKVLLPREEHAARIIQCHIEHGRHLSIDETTAAVHELYTDGSSYGISREMVRTVCLQCTCRLPAVVPDAPFAHPTLVCAAPGQPVLDAEDVIRDLQSALRVCLVPAKGYQSLDDNVTKGTARRRGFLVDGKHLKDFGACRPPDELCMRFCMHVHVRHADAFPMTECADAFRRRRPQTCIPRWCSAVIAGEPQRTCQLRSGRTPTDPS